MPFSHSLKEKGWVGIEKKNKKTTSFRDFSSFKL
jgi:hypothetical protein